MTDLVHLPPAVPLARARMHAVRIDLRDQLRRAFHARGVSAWIGLEVPIVHRDRQALFADLAVCLGADPRPRRAWVTNVEGRSVDVVVRIFAGAERARALDTVVRHVELGAHEAFAFDRVHGALWGFRRGRGGVHAIPALHGGLRSRALGVDLVPRGGRVSVATSTSASAELHEVLERLDRALDRIQGRAAPAMAS